MAAIPARAVLAGLGFACAALPAAGADPGPIDPGTDYHSYANVEQFRVTHIDLDLRVELEVKSISGTVEIELKRHRKL